ncbi:MAG: MGMT family protein [Pirellulales bacterium]
MRKVIFNTPLGWIGLEAGARGLRKVFMALPTEREARAKLEDDPEIFALDHEELDRDAPKWLCIAIQTLRDYADGGNVDPTCLPIETPEKTEFQQRVIRACRKIPRGETATYGKVAALAGSPGAARAVGRVMATNRLPLVIPCHRVVGSTGLHGFSAPGGLDTKRRLLELESVVE